MSTRSPGKLLLVALAVAALGGEGACGVMFGSKSGSTQSCGIGTCTTNTDCSVECTCADGPWIVHLCLTDKSCCAADSDACQAGCASHGGWTAGSAGASGYGGSSGFGGSGGYGGSGGSGGSTPTEGDTCYTPGVSCGCDSFGDCNAVLECTYSGSSWTRMGACNAGSCSSGTTKAYCPDDYIAYALAGTSCSGGDFACSADRTQELSCSGGIWMVNQNCSSSCVGYAPSPTCASVNYCVGCK